MAAFSEPLGVLAQSHRKTRAAICSQRVLWMTGDVPETWLQKLIKVAAFLLKHLHAPELIVEGVILLRFLDDA